MNLPPVKIDKAFSFLKTYYAITSKNSRNIHDNEFIINQRRPFNLRDVTQI